MRVVDFRDIPLEPDPLLFHRDGLCTHLQARLIDAQKTVENWEPDHLLQTPEHDIIEQLTERFDVECPTLDRDQIQALPGEEGYSHFRDGFGDQIRQRIVVRRFVIRFIGDANVFAFQASTFTMNPPRGRISSSQDGTGELQISLQALQGQVADPNQIRQAVHADLDKIDQHLTWFEELDLEATRREEAGQEQRTTDAKRTKAEREDDPEKAGEHRQASDGAAARADGANQEVDRHGQVADELEAEEPSYDSAGRREGTAKEMAEAGVPESQRNAKLTADHLNAEHPKTAARGGQVRQKTAAKGRSVEQAKETHQEHGTRAVTARGGASCAMPASWTPRPRPGRSVGGPRSRRLTKGRLTTKEPRHQTVPHMTPPCGNHHRAGLLGHPRRCTPAGLRRSRKGFRLWSLYGRAATRSIATSRVKVNRLGRVVPNRCSAARSSN